MRHRLRTCFSNVVWVDLSTLQNKIMKTTKISDYSFTISSDSENLNLDFEPLIRFFNLDILYEKFVLCHWRAKVDRNFGWYDFLTKQYYAIDWNNIVIEKSKSIPIQINQMVLPSAVIFYPDAYLENKGSKWKLITL